LVKFTIEFDDKGEVHPIIEIGGELLPSTPSESGEAKPQEEKDSLPAADLPPTSDGSPLGEKRIFVEYHGKIYQTLCVTERDFWDAVHRSFLVRGKLQITDEEDWKLDFSDAKSRGRCRVSYIDRSIYARIAEEEHEALKTHIIVCWQGKLRNFGFTQEWDLWSDLKQWRGNQDRIRVQNEDGSEITEWVQFGTYNLRDDGILIAPKPRTGSSPPPAESGNPVTTADRLQIFVQSEKARHEIFFTVEAELSAEIQKLTALKRLCMLKMRTAVPLLSGSPKGSTVFN
jgi:hypothetical protein